MLFGSQMGESRPAEHHLPRSIVSALKFDGMRYGFQDLGQAPCLQLG